ncbi:pyruvate, phosphate dikinase [Ehrlichia chaffeensis str. Liberty]|uniref:Pyruvate, phosphate dikinase n=1 Tax=Ehrlichia chaffeensis (strain ATCC CRL-10679 / Arkansas) TaxID=205920 RepID=Q2GHD3_EHRCR|nr:pyruvate, phosphate dikinase [Ehrlichia chaffeensis]ABD45175.1 pyruvate, phosphate dikinase [Ehrlichia chaffeensis str. Arkansas]AHX05836.1 pyruvate, phosphate dikinase [Ehrlichia chaffeensis str. Jax]AHX06828.1 pyruvate, phosphate dikinase [Ehrlichia chaffeensis str. Liberty]AHX08028.1 pyruvate, phosphate dikinase [Ehrlichia chaffeensis str. Osceola]AHX08377.1 pyruvate, phosphate dikinase [Ehrlichia chaffeensis str. Saint Vincent]
MSEKLIYYFSKTKCDGSLTLSHILGGKGANLAEMCNIGVDVPPGFTVSTAVCNYYYQHSKLPDNIFSLVENAIEFLNNEVNLKFGDNDNPLLFSVRSGSVSSMPGMLDTILNVGLNDNTVIGLAKKSGEFFAYDSYRRLIQMYAHTVLQIESNLFEEVICKKKREAGIPVNSQISDPNILKEIIIEFKKIVSTHTNKDFPQDVHEQLYNSIDAVFRSWMNKRAVIYRKIHNIPDNLGTAVNVQSMVFGNMSQNSATGVVFTRNPSTGEKEIFGEFLVNAQGEDVVSGTHIPLPLNKMQELMPQPYSDLEKVCQKLELHYREMQDVEFTIENGKLWILQSRPGKRSIQSAVKIAVDMVEEKLISREEAILRIDYKSFSKLFHPILENNTNINIIARGLPASPGAATGYAAFTPNDAEQFRKDGKNAILIRQETNPEDINGMNSSVGIITLRGGMTSHAAVVARGMGKPCICSANGIFIDKSEQFFYTNTGLKVHKGDNITINGCNGEVILGTIKTVTPKLSESFYKLMQWVDEIRILKVMANADTPEDTDIAMNFQADGIGLCRTEHMFFSDKRISIVQEMIVSDTKEERIAALEKLEVMQKEDFKKIFKSTINKQVTIRLLDPPLHEFLPDNDNAINEVSVRTGKSLEKLRNKVLYLSEKNPMLGHRGCRLAISYPEIYEMQVRAIFLAIKELQEETDITGIVPEIMIPLVMNEKELVIIKELISNVAQQFNNPKYSIGTMIELPKAALIADKIAQHAQFFSFGTNDLTQTTLGVSRDDSASFIEIYKDLEIIKQDPFETLDIEGVGKLISIAVDLGRKSSPNIKIGICGEHGGNFDSIQFFAKLNLNYISCSPYRIPTARLIAAQAAIMNRV